MQERLTNSQVEPAARVLSALKQRPDEFVSGAALAADLGVSRAAVWKQIRVLRQQGYEVLSRHHFGYRLVEHPDMLDGPSILADLPTRSFGRSLSFHGDCPSTMELATRAAAAGAPEGHLVIARRQTAGRGRYERPYFSPDGGLWFSLVLRPRMAPAQVGPLSLVASVAVAEAAEHVTGLRLQVKWPNDLRLENRKVCGILLQVSGEVDLVHALVLGVGLNVNVPSDEFPDDLQATATSLSAALAHPVPRVPLLHRVIEGLEARYQEFLLRGPKPALDAWRTLPNMLGQSVRVQSGRDEVVGIAVAVDDDGMLLVQERGGSVQRVVAGDVMVVDDDNGSAGT